MTLGEFATRVGGRGAAPDEIEAFEALVGHTLPEDYRHFLSMTGGGSVPGLSCTFRDDAQDKKEHVRRMGGLNNSELANAFTDPSEHPLPEGLLWIGSDVGGNPLMISLRKDRWGEIFLIDHEMVAYEGEPDPIELAEENGLAFSLAPNFSYFVAGLRPED